MPTVNVTIPVYNEETRLARSLPKLHRYLSNQSAFDFELVIADNGSTDRTLAVANRLQQEFSAVRVLELSLKGRGRALYQSWLRSDADVVSYMDVDLATDISHFPGLVGPLLRDEYDVAFGSRLLQGSHTHRSLSREVISRCYNMLVKAALQVRFSDAQCGFKALRRDAARRLLPLVDNRAWFFDTELLVIAEFLRFRLLDLPVDWSEDGDTRVRIVHTAIEDLNGIARLYLKLRRWKGTGHPNRDLL